MVIKVEVFIDVNYFEVVKIVNEVMVEVEKREFELLLDEYIDVIEEVI